jgi:hypothetical protein
MGYIQDAVLSAVAWVFNKVGKEWGDALWAWFSKLFLSPTAVINDPDVLQLNAILAALSTTLMVAMIAALTLRYQMERAVGDSQIAPEVLVKRCLLAGLAVSGAPTIAWAGGYMADEMVNALGSLGIDFNLLKTFFVLPGTPGLGLIILCLVFLAGIACLLVQRFIMDAEFTILMAVGPIMGISLLRNEQDGAWQNWLREVASILLTPVLQLLVSWFFIKKFASASPLDPKNFFLSFGYLFVMFRMPRWARTWMYSAGGGDTLVAGGQAVGRMVAMRVMLRGLGKGV